MGLQEYARIETLIRVVKASLVMLGKAIKGTVLMSAELEGMWGAQIHLEPMQNTYAG